MNSARKKKNGGLKRMIDTECGGGKSFSTVFGSLAGPKNKRLTGKKA